MKLIPCTQGTEAWHQAHTGLPSASRFDRIVTPLGKLSAQSDKYLNAMVAERVLGNPIGVDVMTDWMQRGLVMEQYAVPWYELQADVTTEVIGFCTTDDGRVGCSPDRLVGLDGLLECKCPTAATHVGYMLNDGSLSIAYRVQIMGQLWVTGRAWCDALSYCEGFAPVCERNERDEPFIRTLSEAVMEFCDRIVSAHDRLMVAG